MVLFVSYFFLVILLVVSIIVGGGMVIQRISRELRKQAMLSVTIARDKACLENFNAAQEIEASQELYKRLYEFRIPFTAEMAVPGVGEEINFYILVPKVQASRVQQLIKTLLPNALVAPASDHELWLDGVKRSKTTADFTANIKGAYLKQLKGVILPLKASKNADFSPFLPILGVFSGLKTIY